MNTTEQRAPELQWPEGYPRTAPAERWERREWEQQADVTLGCEPDFPGDER